MILLRGIGFGEAGKLADCFLGTIGGRVCGRLLLASTSVVMSLNVHFLIGGFAALEDFIL